ncbi:hypothetical protein ACFODT_07070 [Vibrio zhugei]|uniref:Uncharacterized protein n=1 Tax=Vibrio zhugei TaxID=2479546 RepID=A0ABV7C6D1_9VIBR|nr:hypothetical protein [Vibrio zhugei]
MRDSNKRMVWIESNALHTRKSPLPIAVSRIENIRVKEYNITETFKRSALIALVFSFPFIGIVLSVSHYLLTLMLSGSFIAPVLSVPFLFFKLILIALIFALIFGVAYLRTKKYELLVTLFNNSDIGSVESGVCLSNDRDEFDDVVTQIKARQNS